MSFVHVAEAWQRATERVRRHVATDSAVKQALLVTDLFGKLRLVLWAPATASDSARMALHDKLAEECGLWWTGEILPASDDKRDSNVWNGAWAEARRDPQEARLRHLSRHRTRTAWFSDQDSTLWGEASGSPPIVVFYSFKGGLGRTTTLASFAIQRARLGERVAVVDFDLDAPGVGTLLAADTEGTIAPWGVVDYLIERAQVEVPLSDYHHGCARASGSGEIRVFPAGTIDEAYADKLARVDLEEPPDPATSTLLRLLDEIRTTLEPNWILLDARTGVSEPAGRLLSGIAHLHVLFGTTSEQSWRGLRSVIDRLGRQRLLEDQAQAEILLVQAMVPATFESSRLATSTFEERAREEFLRYYYADAASSEDERFWNVGDLESNDAPHAPMTLPYRELLAHFGDIGDIADLLGKDEYLALGERIAARFRPEES